MSQMQQREIVLKTKHNKITLTNALAREIVSLGFSLKNTE